MGRFEKIQRLVEDTYDLSDKFKVDSCKNLDSIGDSLDHIFVDRIYSSSLIEYLELVYDSRKKDIRVFIQEKDFSDLEKRLLNNLNKLGFKINLNLIKSNYEISTDKKNENKKINDKDLNYYYDL